MQSNLAGLNTQLNFDCGMDAETLPNMVFVIFYHPRSEAREGYVFIGICLFNSGEGGGDTRCIMG